MAAASPTTSTHKHLVSDFPTGSLAREIYPHGNGSATSNTFTPRLRSKDGIRLRRAICMSRDPKGAAAMVTRDLWDKSILKCECPVLVECYASWCGPCRMVHDWKIKCYQFNTDHGLHISCNYDVKAVPVVMVFKDGEKRESVIRTMPKSFYEAAIRRAMEAFVPGGELITVPK